MKSYSIGLHKIVKVLPFSNGHKTLPGGDDHPCIFHIEGLEAVCHVKHVVIFYYCMCT